MTAINVLVERRQVHIISDGAITVRGYFFGLTNKVIALPHLGIAIAVRGRTRHVRRILSMLQDVQDYEKLKAQLPGRLRRWYGWRRFVGLPNVFDMVIAAHQNDGAEALFLCSHNGNAGIRAFAWVPIECFVFTPDYPGDDSAAAERWRRASRSFDDAALIDIVDEQRKVPFGHNRNGEPWYGVGGFVQVTTVSSDGINQRVLRRYGEALGSRLEPLDT